MVGNMTLTEMAAAIRDNCRQHDKTCIGCELFLDGDKPPYCRLNNKNSMPPCMWRLPDEEVEDASKN